MREIDRHCVLIFDEISLSEQLVLDKAKNQIVGYVDLGSFLGIENEPANHALVFMVRSLYKNWKQPSYYFTRYNIKSNYCSDKG